MAQKFEEQLTKLALAANAAVQVRKQKSLDSAWL